MWWIGEEEPLFPNKNMPLAVEKQNLYTGTLLQEISLYYYQGITVNQLSGKAIVIVGPKKTNNELMCHFLGKETGADCSTGGNGYQIPALKTSNGFASRLLLWDCQEKNVMDCLKDYAKAPRNQSNQDRLAFFNVPSDWGMEKEAISRGAWGFFYESDSLEKIKTGIQAIFMGEIWVSRRVLTQCIVNRGVSTLNQSTKNSDVLTEREIEILSLIATGATNADIANKLHISQHTVKTHIYNIFQKVNVPNRLQAALWAGKNL